MVWGFCFFVVASWQELRIINHPLTNNIIVTSTCGVLISSLSINLTQTAVMLLCLSIACGGWRPRKYLDEFACGGWRSLIYLKIFACGGWRSRTYLLSFACGGWRTRTSNGRWAYRSCKHNKPYPREQPTLPLAPPLPIK